MTNEEKVRALQRFSRAWAAALKAGRPSKTVRNEFDRATRILLRELLGREPKEEELELVWNSWAA